MAKVLLPFLSERALGSVGTLTASESKQNSTMRLRVNPAQPRTSAQLSARSLLAAASAYWATLSDANRTAWASWAADHPISGSFGRTVALSGHQMFCRLSSLLGAMGKTVSDTPPTTTAPTPLANFAATGGTEQVSLAWTAKAGTNLTTQVWLQGPMSPGRAPDIRGARVAVYAPSETSPKVISSLAAGHYAVFARVISEDDGQASSFVSDTFDVSAA